MYIVGESPWQGDNNDPQCMCFFVVFFYFENWRKLSQNDYQILLLSVSSDIPYEKSLTYVPTTKIYM